MATTTAAVDVTVVGLVDLSSGTGSPLSWYDPQSAQRLLGTSGKVLEIFVAAEPELAGPIARTGSFVGGLAGRNAVRGPRRTVITAGSLALGLALVSALSVLASSTKATLDDAADNSLTADLVVLPLVGVTPMPAPVTDAVQSAPGVSAASPILFEPGLMRTSVTFVTGVDPVGAPQVLNLDMLEGYVTALDWRGSGSRSSRSRGSRSEGSSCWPRCQVSSPAYFPARRASRMEVLEALRTL